MRIEVDQSGRLEFPGPSVIAFSNKEKEEMSTLGTSDSTFGNLATPGVANPPIPDGSGLADPSKLSLALPEALVFDLPS